MIYDVGNLIAAQREIQSWRTKESLCSVMRENKRQELIESGVAEADISEEDCAPYESKCGGCCKRRIDENEIKERIDKCNG